MTRGCDPQVVVITGASSGLGAALAQAYAAPGRTLGLIARRAPQLEAVAEPCRRSGAVVRTGCVDVCDRAALVDWLTSFDDAHPIDLLIVNAGVFDGRREGESAETFAIAQRQIEVNLVGAIATVDAVAARLRRRKQGRIALVSSLAARSPLPDAPGYSASKAGLAAYAEALRELLAEDGVGVTLILPGHIETAQTAAHAGAMPRLMSAKAAAARIKSGLGRGQAEIAFPASLGWAIRVGRLVPWWVRARLARSLRFHVRET